MLTLSCLSDMRAGIRMRRLLLASCSAWHGSWAQLSSSTATTASDDCASRHKYCQSFATLIVATNSFSPHVHPHAIMTVSQDVVLQFPPWTRMMPGAQLVAARRTTMDS